MAAYPITPVIPLRSPREAARCKLPLCPPPRPSRDRNCAPRKETKEMTKKTRDRPLLPPHRRHEGWGGQEQWPFFPGPQSLRLRPAFPLPLPAFPELPFRHFAPLIGFLFHRRHYSFHVCRCEKAQNRLTAPPIGEEVPDPPPALPPPCLLLHLRPEHLLHPFGHTLKRCSLVCEGHGVGIQRSSATYLHT